MTRVLFWNIEQFTDEKFFSASPDTSPNTGGQTKTVAADARRQVLFDALESANPDIFVIVEVLTNKNKNTRIPLPNKGIYGNVWLLEQLRAGTAPAAVLSADWRLVPPFWLAGDNDSGMESVAVFYRGTTGTGADLVTRYFTGPNLWSGGPKGRPVRPGMGVTGQAYNTVSRQNMVAVDVNAMLVPPTTTARTIPGSALHNPGAAENVVAARYQFMQAAPNDTIAQTFGTSRPPFMATFTEVKGSETRNITLLACHGPRADAPGFITRLADTAEVASAPGTGETRLVAGDFNVNLLQPDGTLADAYEPLTTLTYELLLKPTTNTPPIGLDAYKGYFATTIDDPTVGTEQKVRDSKLLWSATDTDLAYYPAYGYASPARNLFSLDNILVRPHVDTQAYNTSILNFIVGAPLTGISSPPGNPPVGTLAMPVGLTGGWPELPTAAVFEPGAAALLSGWAQYGHLRAASDHFALFVDV